MTWNPRFFEPLEILKCVALVDKFKRKALIFYEEMSSLGICSNQLQKKQISICFVGRRAGFGDILPWFNRRPAISPMLVTGQGA
jgi:hypothetical protein